MITKTDFINLIELYKSYSKELDKWCKLVPMFESELINTVENMFIKNLQIQFTEEGYDWITWWLWEKDGNPELKAYYEDKSEIPIETVEDLWNMVKNYIK